MIHKTSIEIHDAINGFDLGEQSSELMASRILDILIAMNDRMDGIEEKLKHQSQSPVPCRQMKDP